MLRVPSKEDGPIEMPGRVRRISAKGLGIAQWEMLGQIYAYSKESKMRVLKIGRLLFAKMAQVFLACRIGRP